MNVVNGQAGYSCLWLLFLEQQAKNNKWEGRCWENNGMLLTASSGRSAESHVLVQTQSVSICFMQVWNAFYTSQGCSDRPVFVTDGFIERAGLGRTQEFSLYLGNQVKCEYNDASTNWPSNGCPSLWASLPSPLCMHVFPPLFSDGILNSYFSFFVPQANFQPGLLLNRFLFACICANSQYTLPANLCLPLLKTVFRLYHDFAPRNSHPVYVCHCCQLKHKLLAAGSFLPWSALLASYNILNNINL